MVVSFSFQPLRPHRGRKSGAFLAGNYHRARRLVETAICPFVGTA
jgi:hypothetical protein